MNSKISSLLEDRSIVNTFPAILQNNSTTDTDPRRAGVYLDLAQPYLFSGDFAAVVFLLAGLQTESPSDTTSSTSKCSIVAASFIDNSNSWSIFVNILRSDQGFTFWDESAKDVPKQSQASSICSITVSRLSLILIVVFVKQSWNDRINPCISWYLCH